MYGFLARCAPGTPDADRIVRRFALEDARHDRARQRVPRDAVAKKGGHVDEDGVTEVIELGRVLLEQLRELGVAPYANRLHPFVDASGQAGSLIPGKIEATASLQVLEERVELSCPV